MTVYEGLQTVYFAIFLPLAGLVMWNVWLGGRTEGQLRRIRRWTLQLQRLHVLVILAVAAAYIDMTAGFEHLAHYWPQLMESTVARGWIAMFFLSVIGLFALGRVKLADSLWLIAAIAVRTQIGHAAASDDRIIAGIASGLHIAAASLWAGGLLLVVLSWRKYRYDAIQLMTSVSGSFLLSLTLLLISGLVSSALYLPDLSYLLETRWGWTLIAKLAAVAIAVFAGSIARSRYRRSALSAGRWLKFDLLLVLAAAALSGLLTVSDPVPDNRPLYWHEMGESVHLTVAVHPMAPGMNEYAVTVWLPSGSGQPRSMELYALPGKSGPGEREIRLEPADDGDETVFPGFDKYDYKASGEEVDEAGWWRIRAVITDGAGEEHAYERTVRVY